MDRPLSTTPEAAVLRRVLNFIFENLFWLVGGVAVGGWLGWTAQQFLPATYEAQGSFVVNEVPFLQKFGLNTTLNDHATEDDLVQSLILGIPSLSMRTVAAARLGIAEKQICFEDISSGPLSLRSKEPVANIRVTSMHNSRTGTIIVRSQSAEFAARVANTLLDELCNYNLAQGRLDALDLDTRFALSRSESIQAQLSLLGQTRGLQEQQVAQLDEYLKQELLLESFPAFATDTTLNNLKTQRLLNQADYAGLAYSSSGGLQLDNKKAQVADINKEIKQQAQSLADGLRSQLAAVRIQEHNLQAELHDMQQKIQRSSYERAEWVQSFGDIAAMEKMIAGETNSQPQRGSAVVVVNRAIPAERAKSPKLWLNLLMGIFVGSLAGLLVAVMRTLLDDRLVSPKTVAPLTNLPCVATTVRAGIFSWNGKNLLTGSRSPAGFDPLRSRLLLTAPDTRIQIIGFTPARKQERSSKLVADLALMLARAGHRTLVVDLHFSKPRQSRLLGIKPQRGLANWMASDEPIENYIWPAESGELCLLSCEPDKKTPVELIARRPLAGILPQFESWGDFILIDAPAISSSWNLALALPAESTLIITARRRRTRAHQVIQTALIAQSQNWNVAGVALLDC